MKKPVIFLLSLAVFGCDTESHQAGIPAPAPAPAQAHESSVVPAEAVEPQKTTMAKNTVYKCKTKDGVTFSDTPCAGDKSEKVVVKEVTTIDNSDLRAKAKAWERQDAIDRANRPSEPNVVFIGDRSSGGMESSADRNRRLSNQIDCKGMSARACADLQLRRDSISSGYGDPGSSIRPDPVIPPPAATTAPRPPEFITNCNPGGCYTNSGKFIPR